MNRITSSWHNFLRLCRRWKLLTLRKIVFLPHILAGEEKRLMIFLALVAVLAGGSITARAYLHFTHPVPGIGGSYTEGIIGAPRAINPLYLSRDTDRDLARLIFSGLITYDGAGNAIPDLAEHFDISPDGKIYTVTLRPNIRWHDGEPLTADDVVFTISRIQNAQYKSPARINWQGVEVQKIDDRTIRFVLRAAYAPFIENLTQGIIPKHLWEHVDPGQMLLHDLNTHPVGSGPYQFSRFKTTGDGSFVWYALGRNTSYYREGPYLQNITFVFFNTEEEMLASWHKGEIDGFGPILAGPAKEITGDRALVLALATPRIFSIFFNQRQAPALAETPVRTAIADAIDKERIAQETPGGAIVVDSILPPFQKTASGAPAGGAPPAGYDPDHARMLLDTAGWRDTNNDGVRDKKIRDKKKTVLTPLRLTLATGDSPELAHAAELIKTMLGDIGIDVIIIQKPFSDLQDTVIRPRAYDMLLFGQAYGYEPDPFAFWHSSQIKDPGLNIALFADKKADKILENARATAEPAARSNMYAAFARLADQEIPAVPLYTQLYLYLLPRDMQFTTAPGVTPLSHITLPADRFNEINRWYRKTTRAF